MPSFMRQIEDAQPHPLDLLAREFRRLERERRSPNIEFCQCVVGASDSDAAIARRLGVPISLVRGWREIGRRAR